MDPMQELVIHEPCGSSKMNEGGEAYEPIYIYDEAFPALPESDPLPAAPVQTNQWTQRMKVNTTVITQMFRVPVEERRFKEIHSQFGDGQGQQAKICSDIMQRTGAHIEINSAKDQSLTILVTGKPEAVLKARREIVNSLQTQAQATIMIPKEHHRFVLGKNGKKLHELELATATKITIPRSEENSEALRIVGTKEGIEKARHEIQLCSDEQAKLAFVRMNIPKMYHPFITGAHNENVSRIMTETGARINVPPPSVHKDELTIAGEKEGVAKAKDIITKIYEDKKRRCQTVSVEVRKSQHKYVVGPRGNTLHEILAQTGVSVEIPPLESLHETITLRGEQDKLGPALTLVYAKANSVVESEVEAPSWLHKFIIGRKGANIRQITQDLPRVHVEFRDGQDKIVIEGPPEEVEQAQTELQKLTLDLVNRIKYDEIEVESKYHKHIIGKNGANVNRIKQETNVLINIPSDNRSNIIRIEGNPQGVMAAKQELLEMVKKLENETSRDVIIDHRFHRTIIGAKGEKIKEIRDKFNQVNITFAEPGAKSDVVTIRGPREDVELGYKYLQRLHKDLIESNYKIEVPIFKQLHKFIIGKAGATIKKIRDDTDTKIDLPAEGSNSDVIVITGKKANVEEARRKILEIQNSHENTVTDTVTIPAKFHNLMIGAKGRLIRSIMEEYRGVSILFPSEGSGSDEVTIRGSKEDVEKAKKQLLELANEKQLSSFTVEVRAKPEHHKFLIGRNGVNIKKVRDKTGARIIFPSENDDDREVIMIIGKKAAVFEAKAELETLIKDLDNIIECEINVDPKYHRHFVARRGQVLRDLGDEYGGVTVSFPRSMTNSDKVILKGAKDCVEGAIQRINEIVCDLEQQVTIECSISQRHHRTVMGAKGFRVQNITQEFDVQIKFPDREIRDDTVEELPQNGEEVQVNGDVGLHVESSTDVVSDKPKKNDIIKIHGKKENCEKAKIALLALVPITEEVNVPFEFHRFIIGQKGKDVRELMKEFDVNITVPPANDESDVIRVTGTPVNVQQAITALQQRVEQLEKDKQDRVLRNFQLKVEVDPKHHPKIIGRKGAVISKIRQDHDVQIQFPGKGEPEENVITITGYEKNADAARHAIIKIVQELEDMVSEEVPINHTVHSRLIGARGRTIRKIMDQYKVDIRFPRDTDPDPNLVVITGVEDLVFEAKDYLLNLEEEYVLENFQLKVEVDPKHYPKIMGRNGTMIRKICQDHEVRIQCPSKGELDRNVITITGCEKNADAARCAITNIVQELENMVSEEVHINYTVHSHLIGARGRTIRKIMDQFKIDIHFPRDTDPDPNLLVITGVKDLVFEAKDYLLNLEEEYLSKNFQLKMEVDPKHHPRIIGRKGAVISKIGQDHDVQIQFPDKREPEENVITITGYEKNADAARHAIIKIVQELEDMVSEEVPINHTVHSRLIGVRGRTIRKIMDQFQVDIHFPRDTDPDPNLVVVTGAEDHVFEAKDYLLNLEEEYLQDVNDVELLRQHTQVPSRGSNDELLQKDGKGFVVEGGPWEQKAPDTSSSAEFPSFDTH